MPEDPLLPTEQEQSWLLAELATLVRGCGWERFIRGPIVEPTPRFFPTKWTSDGSGFYWTTRRLMVLAGLEHREAAIEVYPVGLSPDEHAVAWFCDTGGRICHFGVNVGLVRGADQFVAAMAHEVAHAYRAEHGLRRAETLEDEILTDLTTVYLGFGLLSTNAAYEYRKRAELVGSYAVTEWSHNSIGYLPAPALAFLLAVQMVVRRADPQTIHHLHGLLEPTQRATFDLAVKRLQPRANRVATELGIPEPAWWPAATTPDVIAGPLEGTPRVIQVVAPAMPPPNAGRPVFRVRHTSANRAGAVGAMLGLVVGFAGLIVYSVHTDPIPKLFVFVPVLVTILGGIVGGRIGGRRRWDLCCDPTCQAILPDDAVDCPGCGGRISGRIRHENDRLAAAEALEEARER